jgi:hypothetical protein
MTMSTIGLERSLPRAKVADARRELIRDSLELGALAALAAIVGAFWPAGALAALVMIASGSADVSGHAFALGLPMLAVTVPTGAIWWLGAIRTRRAVRAFHASWAGRER